MLKWIKKNGNCRCEKTLWENVRELQRRWGVGRNRKWETESRERKERK